MEWDPEQELLSPSVLRLLMTSFDLSAEAVIADVEQVLVWRDANDDLLVWLEQRHEWSARTTARYLRHVRFSLGHRSENTGSPPEA